MTELRHRARPRAAPAARGARRARFRRRTMSQAASTATRSRRVSTPRTRSAASAIDRACSTASPFAPASGCASTPVSRTARRCRVHYDPMLAKVIAWAPTRAEAARRLARGARARPRSTASPPIATCWCASSPPRVPAGDIDTGFLERHDPPIELPARRSDESPPASVAARWQRARRPRPVAAAAGRSRGLAQRRPRRPARTYRCGADARRSRSPGPHGHAGSR